MVENNIPEKTETRPGPPTTPDKKSDLGLFIGVVGLIAAVFIPVLQANGVDVNWQVSICVYLLLVGACNWSFLRHAVPGSALGKRVSGVIFLTVLIGGLGFYATAKQYHREHPLPPKTKQQVVDELTALSQRQDWRAVETTISSLESDSNFHDVVLYFRGIIYSHAHPTSIDPDQYLSLVPQDSTLFSDAQLARLANWAATPMTG